MTPSTRSPALPARASAEARSPTDAKPAREAPPLASKPIAQPQASQARDANANRPAAVRERAAHRAPEVRIGTLEIVVEAAESPRAATAAAPAPLDLSSRHYLRGL